MSEDRVDNDHSGYRMRDY